MASRDSDISALTVMHGSNKYTIELPTLGDQPKVHDLALHLQQLTGVETCKQKLIHKGKSLKSDEELSTHGITNGSRIMLIGKKINLEDDENFKSIQRVEAQVNNHEKKLSEIKKEIDGILNGFLEKELHHSALSKLQKRLSAVKEDFLKCLEQLDSLSLGQCEQSIRGKRKTLVERTHAILSQSDSMEATIRDLIENAQGS